MRSNQNATRKARPVAGPRQEINKNRRPPPLPPWLIVNTGVKQGSRVVVKLIGRFRPVGPDKPASRSKTLGAESPFRGPFRRSEGQWLEGSLPGVNGVLSRPRFAVFIGPGVCFIQGQSPASYGPQTLFFLAPSPGLSWCKRRRSHRPQTKAVLAPSCPMMAACLVPYR